MPFQTRKDLPERIQNSLSPEAQQVFMDAFNSAVEAENLDTSKGQAWRRAWEALKEKGYVKGEMSGIWVKKAQEKLNNVVMLSEDIPEEIQVLRTGVWDHPQYGKIEISEHDLDLFIKSFNERARRIDLAIDQAHNPDEGAAGWFQDLFKKEKDGEVGLYAKVEWTDFGEKLLSTKRFKYISPEFRFNYEDDETGQSYENVLYGAGLTNRPFIKEMEPIMMSEDVAEDFIKQNTLNHQDWSEENEEETIKFADHEAIANLSGLEDFEPEDVEELFDELDSSGNLPSGWSNADVAIIYEHWNEEFDQCQKALDGEVSDTGAVCVNIRSRYFETTEASEDTKKERVINLMELNSMKDLKRFGDQINVLSEEALKEAVTSLSENENIELDEGNEEDIVGGIRDSMEFISQMMDKLEFDEKDSTDDVVDLLVELKEKANKFDEKEKEAEKLADENVELEERVTTMEDELRVQKWDKLKNKAMSEGKMTSKQAEFFKERYMKNPEDTKEVIDNLEPVVEMGEKGSKRDIEDGQDAVRRLRSKVQEVKSEEGMTYSEAYKKVAQENPDLYQQAKAERRSS